MGRRKIEIEKIGSNKRRQATFRKRKVGLIKKAIELSVLCNCEISLIIHNEDKVSQFSSEDMSKVWKKYYDFEGPVEVVSTNDHSILQPGKIVPNEDRLVVFKQAGILNASNKTSVSSPAMMSEVAQPISNGPGLATFPSSNLILPNMDAANQPGVFGNDDASMNVASILKDEFSHMPYPRQPIHNTPDHWFVNEENVFHTMDQHSPLNSDSDPLSICTSASDSSTNGGTSYQSGMSGNMIFR